MASRERQSQAGLDARPGNPIQLIAIIVAAQAALQRLGMHGSYTDAYSILFQPVIVRTLPDEWYVGWGDLLMKLDDQDGGYNLPISGRVGKVVKFGDTPINIFVQPSYTPRGLCSGPGGEIWSIKLSGSILFPGADLKAPILNRLHHR